MSTPLNSQIPRGQFTLFQKTTIDDEFKSVLLDKNFQIEEIDIGDITFQAGQLESAQRWYRLTPSFSPGLVRFFISEWEIDDKSFVLDPFSGCGTTIIECQKYGIPCIGFEINPALERVGEYSLKWRPQRSELFAEYLEKINNEMSVNRTLSIKEVAKKYHTKIPNIHDVYRWWRSEVLKDLLICREVMKSKKFKSIQHYLWIALCSSSIDCANIHRNHPTISFDDNHNRKIDVFTEIQSNVKKIQKDLKQLSTEQISNIGKGSIELCNACYNLIPSNRNNAKYTHVITSPPYPNRFSYVHQTRPQLHFMELLRDRSEATEIDLESIGGTWGRATSNLMKKEIEVPEWLFNILDYTNDLRPKSLLMWNYATKYFEDMSIHIAGLRKVVENGFRGAYVVGNSRLYGVNIYTQAILGQIFRRYGFEVEKIICFRKRGGRKRLYETAICVKA